MTDDCLGVIRAASWSSILRCFGVSAKQRRTGVLVGLCVFHVERTPSLHYYPAPPGSGYFCCYGCGRKGTKLDFVCLNRFGRKFDEETLQRREILQSLFLFSLSLSPPPDPRQLFLPLG